MKENQIQEIVEVGHILGDPTRVGIIELLTKGPKAVMVLCDGLDLPQPTVSHHLALLRMARMVDKKRKGKQMIYSLNVKQFDALKKFLAQVK